MFYPAEFTTEIDNEYWPMEPGTQWTYREVDEEGQELEVTSLAAGRYVLVHRVNASRDLRETDYGDNAASMALELSWPQGQNQPPRVDVLTRCAGTATCR